MMRKYYRNRHSTFMKALNEKKKNAEEIEKEKLEKEKQKMKKIREKALANLGTNDQEFGPNVLRRGELPEIE